MPCPDAFRSTMTLRDRIVVPGFSLGDATAKAVDSRGQEEAQGAQRRHG